MKIDENSFVTIDYLIRLGNQETFPPNSQAEEISLCMNWGAMPPGLEKALIGMKAKEHKVVQLTPEEGYGELDQELIMEVPRSDFPEDMELGVGQVFETEDDEGHSMFFLVRELQDDAVVIDLNHPLAGKDLEVTVTVKQVRPATPEELKGVCTCEACASGSGHNH